MLSQVASLLDNRAASLSKAAKAKGTRWLLAPHLFRAVSSLEGSKTVHKGIFMQGPKPRQHKTSQQSFQPRTIRRDARSETVPECEMYAPLSLRGFVTSDSSAKKHTWPRSEHDVAVKMQNGGSECLICRIERHQERTAEHVDALLGKRT